MWVLADARPTSNQAKLLTVELLDPYQIAYQCLLVFNSKQDAEAYASRNGLDKVAIELLLKSAWAP